MKNKNHQILLTNFYFLGKKMNYSSCQYGSLGYYDIGRYVNCHLIQIDLENMLNIQTSSNMLNIEVNFGEDE